MNPSVLLCRTGSSTACDQLVHIHAKCTVVSASLRPAAIGTPLPPVKWAAYKPARTACKHKMHARQGSMPLCASLPADGVQPADDYVPYSVELLLAVARLGHLERYRQEVALLFEPGAPADLTRCALLVSNIFDPQLDHMPVYEQLEDMVSKAALCIIGQCKMYGTTNTRFSGGSGSSLGSTSSTSVYSGHHDALSPEAEVFSGLDPSNPQHLLQAIAAINHVLFTELGLAVNDADLHDPLNGSLADVLYTRLGNQYTLALIYLHVATALGLPCSIMGAPDNILVKVGAGAAAGNSAAFFVDLQQEDQVFVRTGYSNGTKSADGSTSSPGQYNTHGSVDTVGSTAVNNIDQQWQRFLSRQQWVAGGMSSSCSNEELETINHNNSADGKQSLPWHETDSYAALDAASRNSWKALYGPGALQEWGHGGVRVGGSGGGSTGSHSSASTGVGSSSSSNSCGHASSILSSMDTMPDDDGSSSISSSSITDTGCGSLPHVHILSDADIAKYGGLQPISSRVVLQQLLGGMKLSLMMSGRQEELLMVIRYLRATDPFSLPDLRDEALVLAHLQRHEEASALLVEYLSLAPAAADADMAGELLLQEQWAAKISQSMARRRSY